MFARRALVFCALAVALPVSEAQAGRGVSVDLGRIDVAQSLTPGGSYGLAVFSVRNPGDERTTYRMVASPVLDPERAEPPADWFRFEPTEMTLAPGETKPVATRIELPTGADPGDYVALVGAQMVSDGEGARVGAAAAARTTFTVEPASALQAWWLRLTTVLGDHAPWTWLVPALLMSALAAWTIRHRFSFKIERRAA